MCSTIALKPLLERGNGKFSLHDIRSCFLFFSLRISPHLVRFWNKRTNAIGAPAALVAGAVLVTLSETREDTAPRKNDTKRTRFLKLSMRFLLLTSFAFEVISIFVATMTGSVLLGHSEQSVAKKMVGYGSPLQLLHHHHEWVVVRKHLFSYFGRCWSLTYSLFDDFRLEYLGTQICFLQGLMHWLAAVAIELVLPKEKETKSAKVMNKCLAAWLSSMVVWMLAFYNHHLSFYSDYFSMLRRFFWLFAQRYFLEKPIRPLSLLYVPSFLYSAWLTIQAFRSPPELDEE